MVEIMVTIMVKGSSYQNHSLFEINVGSDRIVPTVSDFKFSLNVNDDSFQMNESIKEGEKRTLCSGIEPKRLEIKGIRAESPNHCTTVAHYLKSLFIYINMETKMIQLVLKLVFWKLEEVYGGINHSHFNGDNFTLSV